MKKIKCNKCGEVIYQNKKGKLFDILYNIQIPHEKNCKGNVDG